MIEIHCTNCKTLLSIDEGFAGGVCRCQYCGTIQTVPKHLKDGNGAAPENAKAPKALWQKKGAAAGSGTQTTATATTGTGLDDIASAVASSGLSSGRLTKKDPAPDDAAVVTVPKRKLLWIAVGGGAVILALLGVIVVMLMGRKNDPPPAPAPSVQAPTSAPVQTKPAGTDATPPDKEKLVFKDEPIIAPPPTVQKVEPFKKEVPFLGLKFTENNVIFVIDRAPEATKDDRLNRVKAAVMKTIESMGASRKFQVIFSSADGKSAESFPDEGMANASKDKIEQCRNRIKSVGTAPKPMVGVGLLKALRTKPDLIIVIPLRPMLDDGFQPMVQKNRGDSKIKVHWLSIAQPELGGVLKNVATDTKGIYRDVPLSDLINAAK